MDNPMRRLLVLWLAAFSLVSCSGCAVDSRQNEAAKVVRDYVATVEPLMTQANRVYWEATTTGKPEKFEELKQLQMQARQAHSDPNDFVRIQECREPGCTHDPRLARQVD